MPRRLASTFMHHILTCSIQQKVLDRIVESMVKRVASVYQGIERMAESDVTPTAVVKEKAQEESLAKIIEGGHVLLGRKSHQCVFGRGQIEAWVQGPEGADQRGQLIMLYSRDIAIHSLNFKSYGSCQRTRVL